VNSNDAEDQRPRATLSLLETYLARRPDLVRFFTLRLRSAAAAEDVVQDIYLRIAALDPRTGDPQSGRLPLSAGSNLMLDRLRGERRTAAATPPGATATDTLVGSEEIADEPSAEQQVAARQRLDATIAACAICRRRPNASSGCTSSTG
jgi:RNA polymerase sigma-70 factor (ECF subfamily)